MDLLPLAEYRELTQTFAAPKRIQRANPDPWGEKLTYDLFCHPGFHVEHQRIADFLNWEPPGPLAKSQGHIEQLLRVRVGIWLGVRVSISLVVWHTGTLTECKQEDWQTLLGSKSPFSKLPSPSPPLLCHAGGPTPTPAH